MNFIFKYFIFCLLLVNASFSETFRNTKNLDFLDGLSSININDIAIDKQNRAWIGTYNGISIYDGNEFNNIFNDDSISNKVNVIHSSEEDIWFGTDNGLFKVNSNNYPYEIENFINYNKGIQDLVKLNSNIYSISKNKLLISNILSKETRELDIPEVNNLTIYKQGLLISAKRELYFYDPQNDNKQLLFTVPSKINCLHLDSANLYIGSTNGIFQYQSNDLAFKFKKRILDNKNIESLFFKENKIYISANNNIFILKNNEVIDLNLKFKKIKNILVTKDNALLVGSFGSGLFQVDLHGIKTFFIKGKKTVKLNNDFLTATSKGLFSEDQNKLLVAGNILDFVVDNQKTIWLGTEKGLYKYKNSTSNKVVLEDLKKDITILSINLDKMQRLWLSTLNGLVLFNPKNKDTYIFDKSDGLLSNIIYSTCQVPKGVVATSSGGISYLKNYNNAISYNISSDEYNSCVYDNGRNALWVSTINSGIKLINLNNGEILNSFSTSSGLINNEVYNLYIDNNNQLWVSTDGGGVSIYNGEFWRSINKDDGLISNIVYDIVDIENNYGHSQFLISSENGYSIYTNQKNTPSLNISNVIGASIDNINNYSSNVNSEILIRINPIDYITNPKKYFYRYKSDTTWTYLNPKAFDGSSEIKYDCNKSGINKIEIQFIDRDGNVSKSEIVNLNVLKPWYLRPNIAFPLFGGIFVLLLIIFYEFYIYYKKSRHVEYLKEKEIKRQNEELEKARDFQMNMLPSQSPAILNLDITTHIQTANEVGGDYYDFFNDKQDSLIAILGDATGHGMIAGSVVSITKAGLNSVDFSEPINKILEKLNKILKNVGIGRNRMCLNLCHFTDKYFHISSAGMPPTYIYKKDTQKIEELMISGLPAGSLKKSKYVSKKIGIKSGDVVVMLTDGLPECENEKGEILGYERVKQTIIDSANKKSEFIKEALIKLGDNWLDGIETKDDITFMVIKKN